MKNALLCASVLQVICKAKATTRSKNTSWGKNRIIPAILSDSSNTDFPGSTIYCRSDIITTDSIS